MGRLQNNPSIGWVHPKSTHAHPLAWGKIFLNDYNIVVGTLDSFQKIKYSQIFNILIHFFSI